MLQEEVTMFDFNSPLLGLIVRVIGVGIFIYILYLQLKANAQPQDQFTPTRILLTILITGIIVFTAPSIGYLSVRSFGGESELMRNISTISGAISFIFTAVLLLILYLQKVQKEK